VNLHLKSVPGLGTLTTRSFAGSNFQDLSGKPNRALDSQLLVLGTINEIVAEFLQVADVGRRQGNTDFVDFLGDGCTGRIVLFFSLRDVRHYFSQR